MKTKTIKSILSRKINHWLESIDHELTKEAIKEDVIVSGGAITSMLMNEKVNDYDVYFRTTETAYKVASYYVALFKENPPPKFKMGGDVEIGVIILDERVKVVVKSAGIASEDGDAQNYQYFEMLPPEEAGQAAFDYVNQVAASFVKKDEPEKDDGKKKYRPRFITSNAITLSDDIQIVIRFTGEIEEIHQNYDFTHCKCAYDFKKNILFVPPGAMECMLNKELRYSHSKYPLCSIIRIRKFLERGWHINAGQIVKMAWDLNKLNLSDLKVLEDQMIGVDSAYFQEVIELLKKNAVDGKPIDDAYLMEVIDRVF